LNCCSLFHSFFHFPSIWEFIGVLLAGMAIYLYFIKPKIIISAPCIKANRIEVNIKNDYRYLNVLEVECQVSITKNEFKKVITLNLLKDKTLAIKPQDDYIFKTEDNVTLDDYNQVRIRILARNLIGIKKLIDRVCDLKKN